MKVLVEGGLGASFWKEGRFDKIAYGGPSDDAVYNRTIIFRLAIREDLFSGSGEMGCVVW